MKAGNRKDVYDGSASSPVKRRGYVEAVPYLIKSIGKDMKQARLDAGLTQVEVASLINVSQTMVAGVEQGRIRVGQKYIVSLLKACNQPNDYPNHRYIRQAKAASPRR